MPFLRAAHVAALTLVASFGLASGSRAYEAAPETFASPQLRALESLSLIAVLPLEAADPHIRLGDPMLRRQVESELKAAGYRVAFVEPTDFSRLERAELDALPHSASTLPSTRRAIARKMALVRLARITAKEAGATLLLQCRLVLRAVEIRTNVAEWDGVRRTVKTADGREPPHTARGKAPALSVELLGLDAVGVPLLVAYAGVALPFYASESSPQPEDRSDLFATDHEIASAVKTALAPLPKHMPAR